MYFIFNTFFCKYVRVYEKSLVTNSLRYANPVAIFQHMKVILNFDTNITLILHVLSLYCRLPLGCNLERGNWTSTRQCTHFALQWIILKLIHGPPSIKGGGWESEGEREGKGEREGGGEWEYVKLDVLDRWSVEGSHIFVLLQCLFNLYECICILLMDSFILC